MFADSQYMDSVWNLLNSNDILTISLFDTASHETQPLGISITRCPQVPPGAPAGDLHLDDFVAPLQPGARIAGHEDRGQVLQRTVQAVAYDFIGHLEGGMLVPNWVILCNVM